MMKINKKRFLTFCEAILALAPECRVYLKADGIETRTVDTGNVAMVSAKLPQEAFEQYGVEGSALGFDLTKIKTAVGFMNNDILEIDVEQKKKLRISDERYNYVCNLLDINTIRKDPKLPEVELFGVVIVNGQELHETITAMSKISDKVMISLEGAIPNMKSLKLVAEGDIEETLIGEVACNTQEAPKEPIFSIFSLDYLKSISKIQKDSDEVTLYLGQDHPIKFECIIDQIWLEYLCAPRIEDTE